MTWKQMKQMLPVIPSGHNYKADILVLIGTLVGYLLGSTLVLAKNDTYTSRQIMYVGFPGEIFLSILRCMALPTRITCLVSAVGSMEMTISKRIGLQLLAFIVITKIQAAFLGISLALLFPVQPIKSSEKIGLMEYKPHSTPIDRYLDIIRNLFPDNVVEMTMRQIETILIKPENGSSGNLYEWEIRKNMKKPRNILGTTNYALIFGAAVAVLGRDAKPVLDICTSVTSLSFKVMLIFWRIAPLLIISLIASSVMKTESAGNLANKTAMFTFYVIWGHAIQCWFVYPLIYFAIVRKNPYVLMWSYMDALVTGYATSSSVAALPVAIRCLIEKAKINKKLVEFAVPIGNAVSMDGTALYQAAAVVFFAKLSNTSLTIGDIFTIVLFSVSTSVASGRTPLSNLVGMVIVINVLGLPEDHVGLLLAIDWFIAHSTTATNVLGDCILVGVLAGVNEELFESLEEQEEVEEEEEKKKKNRRRRN